MTPIHQNATLGYEYFFFRPEFPDLSLDDLKEIYPEKNPNSFSWKLSNASKQYVLHFFQIYIYL